MARLNQEKMDPVQYEKIKTEQEKLRDEYLCGVTMARLCPFCHNKVEVLCKGYHAASFQKCPQCGEKIVFPPVEFRTA